MAGSIPTSARSGRLPPIPLASAKTSRSRVATTTGASMKSSRCKQLCDSGLADLATAQSCPLIPTTWAQPDSSTTSASIVLHPVQTLRGRRKHVLEFDLPRPKTLASTDSGISDLGTSLETSLTVTTTTKPADICSLEALIGSTAVARVDQAHSRFAESESILDLVPFNSSFLSSCASDTCSSPSILFTSSTESGRGLRSSPTIKLSTPGSESARLDLPPDESTDDSPTEVSAEQVVCEQRRRLQRRRLSSSRRPSVLTEAVEKAEARRRKGVPADGESYSSDPTETKLKVDQKEVILPVKSPLQNLLGDVHKCRNIGTTGEEDLLQEPFQKQSPSPFRQFHRSQSLYHGRLRHSLEQTGKEKEQFDQDRSAETVSQLYCK
ncbi:unnamed protein product [Protopolystoma xenopodis]|uniref:Uncharacterized protein n=1 Tax=Protopolystoma xenopodis TaxID=117903 RepID=A0A3S5A257_9PLAT|nr:unnamed protein product [Protopolystoma xenopodis]